MHELAETTRPLAVDPDMNNNDTATATKDDAKQKQMLNACCVCGEDDGGADNAIVYCDGPDCQVGVHQMCYGIEHVPAGDWFCDVCEHKQRHPSDTTTLHPCVLCNRTDGAMKLTDTNKWAHIICALYIPECTFGCPVKMDPIVLTAVPPQRYGKRCDVCASKGVYDNDEHKDALANTVVVNCHKNRCHCSFHVTW